MLATRARFCIAALSAFLLLSGCETRQSDILAPARELDLLDAVRRVEISYDTAYTPTADTAQLHSITQNLKLRATAFDSSGSAIYGLSYRWTSSRTSFYIAPDTFSLDTDTTSVTALANGLALVRVIVGDHRDSVWVRERQVADTFSVQPDTALMNPATTLQLAVTARDSLSQPVRLVFSSTDASVATVDTMGLISAVAPGAAKIIVTAAGIRRVVPITVRTGPLVQSIVVQPAVDTLNALLLTKAYHAIAFDTAGDTTSVHVDWSLSDSTRARVDSAGVVTALATGKVVVRASAGGKTASALLRIRQLHQSMFIARGSDSTLIADTIALADTATLTCQLRDVNNQPIVRSLCHWRSADTAIVRVNGDSIAQAPAGSLYGHSLGTTTVTAWAAGLPGEPSLRDSLTVVVKNSDALPVAHSDSASATSATGSSFHPAYNTFLDTYGDAAQNLLTNDHLGEPAATITSFGAVQTNDGSGVLNAPSGTVTSYSPGAKVSPLPGYSSGSFTVNADGSMSFNPPKNYTGLFRFQYRITNSAGTSDATVQLAVGGVATATDDAYPTSIIGNMRLETSSSSGFSILSNDTGDSLRLGSIASVTGGTFDVQSNGHFSYYPDPGFSGNAGFDYTLSNGFGAKTAHVTIPVSTTRVWFIGTDPGDDSIPGNGTQTHPFSLSCAQTSCFSAVNDGAAGHPADNDIIFIEQQANAWISDGVSLLPGQKLYGEDASNPANQTLGGIAGITIPADQTNPALHPSDSWTVNLQSSGPSIINLSTNNTLRGMTLSTCPASFGACDVSHAALFGSGFGTLTVGSDVVINTNMEALNLTDGTVQGNFGGVSSTAGDYNIYLKNVGGTANFGGGSLSGAKTAAIALDQSSAALIYSGVVTSSSNDPGSVISSSNGTTGSLTLNGNITRTAGTGSLVDVTNGSDTLHFNGVVHTAVGTGLHFDNADGRYDFSNVASGSGLSGSVPRLEITNDADGNFSFGSNFAIATTGFPALNLSSSANDLQPVIEIDGPVTQTGVAVASVSNLASGADITLAGSVSVSGNTSLITASQNRGGSIKFTGSQTVNTQLASAIDMNDNAGTTLEFSGSGLAISTDQGSAIYQRVGGTLNILGSNNSIRVTGVPSDGYAVRLDSVAANITLSKIVAAGGATDAAVGVRKVSGTLLNLGLDSLVAAGTGIGLRLTSNSAPIQAQIAQLSADSTALELRSNSSAITLTRVGTTAMTNTSGPLVDVSAGNNNVSIQPYLTKSTDGYLVRVDSLTAGDFNFSGNLSCTSACDGLRIDSIRGNTHLRFSGASKVLSTGASNAIYITRNDTTAKVSFQSGGLAITTSDGAGLKVAGGGIINVQGSNNTLLAGFGGFGPAIDMIGTPTHHISGDLLWKSVSSQGSGSNKAIDLEYSRGTFTVTGDGTTSRTSGGSINNTSFTSANFHAVDGAISLTGMTFTGGQPAGTCTIYKSNPNGRCTAAIAIDSAGSTLVLNHVSLSGSSGETVITGFQFPGVNINDATVAAGTKGGLMLMNTTGSSQITDATFTGTSTHAYFQNFAGTASVVVDGVVSTATSTNDNFIFESRNTSALTVNVSSSTFNHTASAGLALLAGGAEDGSSTLNYTLSNNTLIKTDGFSTTSNHAPIRVVGTQRSTMSGTITGNTIGSTTAGSGSFDSGQAGILLQEADSATSPGTFDAIVTGNLIQHVTGAGVWAVMGYHANANVTITGNQFRNPDNANYPAVYVYQYLPRTGTCATATLGGTTTPGSYPSTTTGAKNKIEGLWGLSDSGYEISAENNAGGTLNLPGLSGPADTFMAARNDLSGSSGATVYGGGTYGSAASCH